MEEERSPGCYGASLGSTFAQVCLTPKEGRCHPLFQSDKMPSAGDRILHRQTSLLHIHHPERVRLLHSECQHTTTNLPAPSQTKTTLSSAIEQSLQGLSHPKPDHKSWTGLAAAGEHKRCCSSSKRQPEEAAKEVLL